MTKKQAEQIAHRIAAKILLAEKDTGIVSEYMQQEGVIYGTVDTVKVLDAFDVLLASIQKKGSDD